jgi:O-methyltransferase involved in polyketide biosynthesis
LSRPCTPEGDGEADTRLSAELARRGRVRRGPQFHYLAARTSFFDNQTLEALDAGLAQVVIVGAGYDGRALRFRKSGVRFLELDHPSTQRDKRRRRTLIT